MWRLNNTLLNNQWVNGEIKKYLGTHENGNTRNETHQNLWDRAKAVVRGNHSDTGLPQETRKYQINHLTLHLNGLEKEEQMKPKLVEGRK